jgi:hypothetical protein
MMSKKCLGSPKYRERYHVEKRAHLVFGIWPIWYIFPLKLGKKAENYNHNISLLIATLRTKTEEAESHM